MKMMLHLAFTVLVFYVGVNLLFVNCVTMIHESKLILRVQGARTGDPIPSARLLYEYPPVEVEISRADSNGVIRYEKMVQDQGSWAFPRLGLTNNLSGLKYRLVADHYENKTISIPEYSGQTYDTQVRLDRRAPAKQ